MTLLNDALSAYLTPLLEKHSAGKVLIYDDLIHSWQAAQAVMETNFDPQVSVSISFFLSLLYSLILTLVVFYSFTQQHLRELHESQLRAYRDAAKAALAEQAQSVSLPAVMDEMEEEQYVQKIVLEMEKPDWKVDETVWERDWNTALRERARAAFVSAQEDNGEEDEEVEMEDNDELEEGEEKPVKPVAKKVTAKKRVVPTKVGKGLLKKKALGAGTGAGQRATRGRRARRGGRGGGGAGAAK